MGQSSVETTIGIAQIATFPIVIVSFAVIHHLRMIELGQVETTVPILVVLTVRFVYGGGFRIVLFDDFQESAQKMAL
jgi:hypothetical protein